MTQVQRDAIPSPANGLLIYQTNGTPGFYYHDGGWKALGSSTSGFANRKLSNLTEAVEINVDLLPQNAKENNLGDAGKEWKNLYLSGDVFNGAHRIMSFGEFATFVGMNAGISNTSGAFNTAIGSHAFFNNTTGFSNTVIGAAAMNSNTIGYENTAYGVNALFSNTTGFFNTAVGSQSLIANTTGNHNTTLGAYTMYGNRTGFSNIAIGYLALRSNTTGFLNTAIGVSAMLNNTEGSLNTATGAGAMLNNITGINNAALGNGSLNNNTTGQNNTAIGAGALFASVGTSNNTAVGTNAATLTLNPSQGTFIGVSARALDNLTNITAIGYNATVTASNQVRIGNTSVTSIGGEVGWTNFSDGRYKKNIKEDVPGLEFINKLRPITYNLDVEEIDKAIHQGSIISQTKTNTISLAQTMSNEIPASQHRNMADGLSMSPIERKGVSEGESLSREAKSKITYTGFVAQEVEKAAREIGYDFSGVDAPKSEQDFYGLRYGDFVVPLVMAFQELSRKTKELENENVEIKKRINKLELMISSASLNTIKSLPGSLQLDQNIPNPFARTTTINYSVPSGIQKAEILISDYSGKLLRTIPVSNAGKGTIEIDASIFINGTYNYTIVCDGKATETRKMIVMR